MAAKVLLTWELGGGLGHLVPNLPILKQLQAAGVQVSICAPAGSNQLRGFEFLEAPKTPVASIHTEYRTYADILWSQGWSTCAGMQNLLEQWQTILTKLRPQLVLGDHSPFAIFAAKTLGIPSIAIGTGFCCPPACSPLPNFRDEQIAEASFEREAVMLTQVNYLLHKSGLVEEGSLWSAVFGQATTMLTTFQELDHYRERSSGEYWGTWPGTLGGDPRWPKRESRFRAFAYLKPHPHLFELFSVLLHYDVSILAYCPGLDHETKQRFTTRGRIEFANEVVDVGRAAAQADFTVLNAGHGTTVTSLITGTPILQMPIYMEQAITARNIERIQAGHGLPPQQPLRYNEVASSFLDQLSIYKQGAMQFADRYRNYRGAHQVARIVEIIMDIVKIDCPESPAVLLHHKDREANRAQASMTLKPITVVVTLAPLAAETLTCRLSRMQEIVIDSLPLHLSWNAEQPHEAISASLDKWQALSMQGSVIAIVDTPSYLQHVDLFFRCDRLEMICVLQPRHAFIQQWLLAISNAASAESAQSINHWSFDRNGFSSHPDDKCYPKYATTNLVEALTRYHADLSELISRLASRYPRRVTHVSQFDEASVKLQ